MSSTTPPPKRRREAGAKRTAAALLANLGILTLLLNANSPLALPTSIFDDSTGFRTRLYWAQLIAICIVTPMSFVLNKLWTFAAVRGLHKHGAADTADDTAIAETADAAPGTKQDTPASTA